jgi:putative oxidoreductase
MVHASVGFLMNWYGQLPAGKEGFEYHILAGAIAIALMVRGGGKWSVDRALTRKG